MGSWAWLTTWTTTTQAYILTYLNYCLILNNRWQTCIWNIYFANKRTVFLPFSGNQYECQHWTVLYYTLHLHRLIKNRYYLLISGHRCTKCIAPSERWQANIEGWLVHGPSLSYEMSLLCWIDAQMICHPQAGFLFWYLVIVLMMNGFSCSVFIQFSVYSNLSHLYTDCLAKVTC